jgi:GTPase SAR1 family protein
MPLTANTDASTGKTALVQKLVLGSEGLQRGEHLPSTLGSTTWSYDAAQGNGERVPLHIWDISGNERYHSMLPSYASNADVSIVAFDVSSEVRALSCCGGACPESLLSGVRMERLTF